jgi:hypothetical protein
VVALRTQERDAVSVVDTLDPESIVRGVESKEAGVEVRERDQQTDRLAHRV